MSVTDNSAGEQDRPAKRIFRPLTEAQWNLARIQFETSDEKCTQKTVAILFKTSLSSVQKRSAREKWSKGAKIVQDARSELQRATSNALAEAAQKTGSEVAKRLMDDLQPWIEREKRTQVQRAIKRSKLAQKRLDRVAKGFDVFDSKSESIVTIQTGPKDEMAIASAEDKYDSIIRRNLGMNDNQAPVTPLTLNVLANHSAIQFVEPNDQS